MIPKKRDVTIKAAMADDDGLEQSYAGGVEPLDLVELRGDLDQDGLSLKPEDDDVLVKMEDIEDVDMKDMMKFEDLNGPLDDIDGGLNRHLRPKNRGRAKNNGNSHNSQQNTSLEGHAVLVTCASCHKDFYIICNLRRHPLLLFGENNQCKKCARGRRKEYLRKLQTTTPSDNGVNEGVSKLWESYKSFEELNYNGDCELDEFMAEWNQKITSALSEGCQLSDPILAFKLLEKTNLEGAVVNTIIRSLTYPTQGESLLSQTVGKIYDIMSSVKDEESPRELPDFNDIPEDDLPAADDLTTDLSASNFLSNDGLDSIRDDDAPPKRAKAPKDIYSSNLKGKKIKCANCDQIFYSKKTLYIHKKLSHPLNDNLDEEIRLLAEMAEKRKQQRIKAKVPQIHSCVFCPKTFKSKGNLTQHMICHSTEKPFVCDHCGKAFADKSYWKLHLRVHSSEKPFLCADCGASFNFRAGYKAHVRKHTGEKPYKCGYCGEGFRKPCMKTLHIRRAHTGERPYICKICGSKFMSGQYLKRHVRRHQTKEEPAH